MQTLKQEIKTRIDDAAILCFSEKGYLTTTMAEIAAAAGISVGNIYRYYANKDALFYGLIPHELINQFKLLLFSKIKTARGIPLEKVRAHRQMNLRDRDLLEFLSRYRLHMICALAHGKGTDYTALKAEIVEILKQNVFDYIQSMKGNKTIVLPRVKIMLLGIFYENLMNVIIEALKMFKTVNDLDQAYQYILDYHFSGVPKIIT